MENHPILDDYKFAWYRLFQKWMTGTIQFWMNINLVQIIPKLDEQNHPILEPYCRFLSLYKKMSYFHPILEG